MPAPTPPSPRPSRTWAKRSEVFTQPTISLWEGPPNNREASTYKGQLTIPEAEALIADLQAIIQDHYYQLHQSTDSMRPGGIIAIPLSNTSRIEWLEAQVRDLQAITDKLEKAL